MSTMNAEQIQAARAAFARDPEAACVALLGKAPEEVFIEALRGCNQHAHKPGCPEAGGSSTPDRGDAYEEVQRALDKIAREGAQGRQFAGKRSGV